MGEESEPGGLQSFDSDGRRTPHEFESKSGVDFEGFPEAAAVKENGGCRFCSAGRKMPAIGREEPGPAEDLPCSDGPDPGGRLGIGLDGYGAPKDQVESVGRIALTENKFTLRELHRHGAGGEGVDLVTGKALQKRVAGNGVMQRSSGLKERGHVDAGPGANPDRT